jgi:hypothetical protein
MTSEKDHENLERIGHAMMLAWQRVKKAQSRMWGEWMTIGEGLLEGRRWAQHVAHTNRPEGKGFVMAYSEWLKRYKVDDMDKSDRAKLLQLMEERPAVEEWRATLTDYERRNLNNPIIVWRKWTAATRVKKPKPRTAGVAATEHGRAQATVEQLQARVTELEEELEAAQERIQELEVALEAARAQQEEAEPAPAVEEPAEAAAESALEAARESPQGELGWAGDDEHGWIGRAGGLVYTIIRQGDDWYEARAISAMPGTWAKAPTIERLHNKYGAPLNDPANRGLIRKTVGVHCKTAEEAKAIVWRVCEAEGRFRG